MKRFKYIHLLWGEDVKFSGPLINMFIESPEVFVHSDHLFVTPYEDVKKKLPDINNIVLEKDGTKAEIINKYAEKCDWLISHDLVDVRNCLRIKRKYFHKIVWRTWGGSRQKTKWNLRKPMVSVFAKLGDSLYYIYMRYTFGTSPVIGIANDVDIVDLEQWKWHKKSKLLPIGYSDSSLDKIFNNIKVSSDKKDCVNFLVGHQGDPRENHLLFVQKLLSYNKKDIKIYLPLSYGDKLYINKLKEELNSLHDERIIIIDRLMPLGDYYQFLSEVDVAIIDEISSMALGNISVLLRFNKKIYLNKDGILKKAFDYGKIPYRTTDEIGEKSYENIIEPILYPQNMETNLISQPYDMRLNRFRTLFSYLDSLKNNG